MGNYFINITETREWICALILGSDWMIWDINFLSDLRNAIRQFIRVCCLVWNKESKAPCGTNRDRMPTLLLDALLKDVPVSILGDEYPVGPPEVVGKHMPSVGYRLYPQAMGGAKKSRDSLKTLSERELAQLVQWSDLLVFDYLTGNYDRLAYMQDAAEKEGRPQILSGTIHNLVSLEGSKGDISFLSISLLVVCRRFRSSKRLVIYIEYFDLFLFMLKTVMPIDEVFLVAQNITDRNQLKLKPDFRCRFGARRQTPCGSWTTSPG